MFRAPEDWLASPVRFARARAIATVLVTGLLIGTMFTLFVLPAIYARFGRQLASPSVTNDRRFSDMEVMS